MASANSVAALSAVYCEIICRKAFARPLNASSAVFSPLAITYGPGRDDALHADFPALISALRRRGTISAIGDPFASVSLFRGRGCAQCNGTGFRGRVGIFELFEISDLVRRMIMDRRDAAAIRDAAMGEGMITLFQDGVAKALLGETTVEEIFKAAV